MTVNVFLCAETVINGRDSNRIMLSTYELLIILALVLLFFGKDKIPELFRGAGQAKKAFNEGMNESLPEDSGEDKVEEPDSKDDEDDGGGGHDDSLHSNFGGGFG